MFASLHTLTIFLTRCSALYTHFILRLEDKIVQITLKIRLSVYCKRCLPVLLQIEDWNPFFKWPWDWGRDRMHLPEQLLDFSTVSKVLVVVVSKSIEKSAEKNETSIIHIEYIGF
jgi:hypothetical protein